MSRSAVMTEARDTVSIRTAQLPDAEAMAHVRVAAWRAAYRGLMPDSYLDRADLEDAEAEHLRDRLQSIGDRTHVSVAELGGRIVGYCTYGDAGDDDAEPARGAIYALYIHPDVWRHGIGRQLLVYASHYLKAQGFGEATLFVVEGNMRARRFYEQAGWKTDGHRRIYEWPGFSLPVLRYRTACG
jgi:ribosomal protein S18 acetylase RimI-like enzyme